MKTAVSCRICGAPVTADARDGVCPKCLFNLAAAGSDPLVSEIQSPKSKIKNLETVLHSFGDYELLEEIARGGMGVVYKARQKSLGRLVAVKLILAGQFVGKQIAQRFKSEAIAAAVLQHPNIVAVHEVGVHEGQHFFSMDYVEGQNLAERVAQRPLPPREAARYVKLIAEAIHYAHGQGILHRDLKPSNVLIDAATDQPRVTDFGLAKRLDGESSLTVTGQVLGSPHFMPPEQAGRGWGKVGRASDVFGLGGILYFLLTARAPFQGETIETTIQQVLHAEPVSPRLLNATVPLDLETICLKCLEKEPSRRYQMAGEVVEELERFLRDEPILARPLSRVERTWRWCRRKPAVAALAAATILLLLAVAIGSPIAAWRIAAARDAERLERQRAQGNANELVKSLYVADMRTAWQAVQDDNLLLARESVYKYLPALGIPVSATELSGSSAQFPGDLHAGAVTRDLLGWEWRRLWALCQSDEIATLHGDGLEIRCAVFSPDSRLVATARGQTVYVTDAHTKKQLAALGGFSGVIDNSAVTFSKDGRYLAAKGGTNVLIWEVGRWESPYQRLRGAPNTTHGNAVLFSSDGGRFMTRVNGGFGVWDTTTWQEEILPGKDEFGLFLSFAGNGEWLAASEVGNIKILNARSLEEVRTLPRSNAHKFRVLAIDSCPKRGLLAAGYRDGEVRLWEIGSWREVGTFQPHPSFTFGLAFSPDGNVLVTGGNEQVIKVWDVTSLTNDLSAAKPREPITRPKGDPTMELPGRLPPEGGPQPLKRLRGHHANIHGLSFAPDGHSFVTASKDGTAKLWNPFRAVESEILPDSKQLAWFSLDGSRLITLNGDGRLHRWHTRNREDMGMVGPNLTNDQVKAWTISGHGETLAVGMENEDIEIWNLKTGQREKSFPRAIARIAELAFSQDAALLAAASLRPAAGAADQATLRIWDTASGAVAGAYTNAFRPLAFSSDKQRLVSTRLDGSVVVWDLGSGRSIAEIEENITWVGTLALSPDCRLLVTGSEEPVVNISELASGKRIGSLKGSRVCTIGVGFSPDARTLATRTAEGAMKFWNAATGKEMFTLEPPNPVHSFLFSPDGEYLAITWDSGSRGKRRVELWRAPSFEEIIAAEKGKASKMKAAASNAPEKSTHERNSI